MVLRVNKVGILGRQAGPEPVNTIHSLTKELAMKPQFVRLKYMLCNLSGVAHFVTLPNSFTGRIWKAQKRCSKIQHVADVFFRPAFPKVGSAEP